MGAEWVDHYRPDPVPAWESIAVGFLFRGFVVAQLVSFILRAPLG
jgi:hypothetical protein